MMFFTSIDPLFEWQISEIVVEVPASYKVRIDPSPWKTVIGDSLSDKSYVFSRVSIWKEDQHCSSRDFDIVINRSRKDELLERLSLWPRFQSRGIDWPIPWILFTIALSMIYLLWFTYWQDHRTIGYTMLSGIFAIIGFCFIMIPIMKLMGPQIANLFTGNTSCQGMIKFSAELVKVNYVVPFFIFAGILAEFGALVIMVHEVVKALKNRKQPSKLAVG